MNEKKEKKDQYIIAYIADFGRTEAVVTYAIHLSRMLHKGLVLLHICDPRHSALTPDDAEAQLKQLRNTLLEREWFGTALDDKEVTYAALKGNSRQLIAALPQLMGAVAVVAQADRKCHGRNPMSVSSLLKNFADCKTAFLVVQEPLTHPERMKEVAMAIDFKKESKDKMIWSSYFPRFGNANMHVLYYDYKDAFLKDKWYANMKQLHKLYTDLGITFQPHIIESKSTYQDINALRFAAAQGYGLLIAVTTKEKDGLEFFIGTQEQRTIVNRDAIPILFLNPREDLYVLCD